MDWDKLTYSLTETDFMYIAQTKRGEPWAPGEVKPFGPIPMHPASAALNYGQGIFEGMKAQRTDEGAIVLFRPEENAARFVTGAKRLGMDTVPAEVFVEAVCATVAANARWVPPAGKGALYVRPLLLGSGGLLGAAPAPEFTFLIFCSPVGAYMSKGLAPISLKVAHDCHRAAAGGQGGVKAIGNYAPGVVPAKAAKDEGFHELLYLDARENRYIEEVGAANFFCLKDSVLYTPSLEGTILPGITRMSLLQIARDLGYEVREERVAIDFAMSADECFCCGTAAVLSPIGSITYQGEVAEFCRSEVGPISRRLYETLREIQLCRRPDPHKWVHRVQCPRPPGGECGRGRVSPGGLTGSRRRRPQQMGNSRDVGVLVSSERMSASAWSEARFRCS